MRPRVAILDDYQRLALAVADWSPVVDRCDVEVFDRHLTEDEAAHALRDHQILCTLRERMALPRTLLERLPKLKLVCVTGQQHRTLDLVAARELGITISHTGRRGSGLFATAELAWGLIIGLLRNIPLEASRMRDGGWQTTCGTSLEGKRLGIVGLGRLGSRMAPVAKAFGMDIVAWSPNLTTAQAQAAGAVRVEKDELFVTSDVVTLHLVLSERSRHTVGPRELSLMKASAVIVNTSRGPLIDRNALIEALRGARIGGAGLDTFDTEPLPDDDELRRLPNVVLTPHLGYTVRELLQPFYEDTVENVLAFLDGRPIRLGSPIRAG